MNMKSFLYKNERPQNTYASYALNDSRRRDLRPNKEASVEQYSR